MVFQEETHGLPFLFISALQGSEDEEPALPLLCCLTVQYSNSGKFDSSNAEKEKRLDELLAIMKTREEAGLPRFTRLEVGWHWHRHVNWSTGGSEASMEEWINCLERASG